MTGSGNVALGFNAGSAANIGSGNVYIGEGITGIASDNNHTYIRNINTNPMAGDTVTVNLGTGLLGHQASSRRYKEDIKPMDKASEVLYRLKPVSYRFKKEIDASQNLDYGLVAEDVADVDPSLTSRGGKGQVESVRYTAVNAMLLNEFLKEHRKVNAQQKQIDTLTMQLKQQEARIQKMSDRLEMRAANTQVVATGQ